MTSDLLSQKNEPHGSLAGLTGSETPLELQPSVCGTIPGGRGVGGVFVHADSLAAARLILSEASVVMEGCARHEEERGGMSVVAACMIRDHIKKLAWIHRLLAGGAEGLETSHRKRKSPNENKISDPRSWRPACCEASRMDDSGADSLHRLG